MPHVPADADTFAKYQLHDGDIVLARTGASTGASAYVKAPPPAVFASYLVRLKAKPEFDSRFLAYYLRSDDFWTFIRGVLGDKSAQPNASASTMTKAPLRAPGDKNEQRAIAHILGTLDDKIELNRRMSETLEHIARALFESWFIRFDPVRRNMARKRRGQPSPPAPLPEGEGRTVTDYRGGYDFSGLVETARALRKQQTPAEAIFWDLVRNRRLLGLKFRRQHQLGDYVADFYCHEHRLVIELDGGVHATKRKKDHKRDAWMEAQGFKVLRFHNEELLDDPEPVLQAIADVVGPIEALPSPSGRRVGDEGVAESAAFDHLFPARLVDSELGEIPEGWEVGSFGNLISQRSERVGRREVVVLSAVASGKLVRSDDHFTKRVYSKETEKYLLVEQWDFAYNPSRINIGSIGMLEEEIVGGVSPVYVVARPTPAYRWFLEFSIRRAHTKTWINTLASGSVRQSLSYTDFASIPCVVPPEEIAREFNRRWSNWRAGIRSREGESRTLAALRDALLPKLISGALRVKDAERFLAERGL